MVLNLTTAETCHVTVSAMSHLRFFRATLMRDSDARQSRSVRLHSRTLRL